ncbi:Stk1 family PASTA domain-containing Ser/Thr kinase [Clostridium sp. CS001]|uniref:Stk1 family PASTA domain-containing Ser/Thr kinase n=1 Tax=Clostridium sp. CS001 TaxID=2880648 RepID=UPI001CF539EF|nr:Stk1 family PASTA domain-containing Ser/Thr kinase [Clostridium sp. CS001]MCB2288405.1 Stk1 family PASTA domain-containing Ser/Thr kinase [Clostridium sp. CS001]
MIGTILGSRYELLEKIGEGGMAIVYKAKCHLLNRYVAVKILKEEYSNNADFMEKFKREAASVASLSSNNIVNIYDVGSERDINYIVMEYIEGKTLKQIILENGSMNCDQVIDYGMQIAKALECAHKNKIIHRDIKPHNILVTEDGTVKVTDFGIAKATSSVTITNTSTVMGSAHYFSPEQAKASFVDCRTDIYSFGIVLYEMTTGRVPYDAESPVSVALKHIQQPIIPPKQINGNIPENLNKLIVKAIEKEPIKRYQTAKEMFLDLKRIQNNSSYNIPTSSNENEYTRIMEPVNVLDYEKEQVPKGEKNKVNKKSKTKIIISVAIILVILLGSALGYILTKGGAPGEPKVTNQILVPKIVGLDKKEAEEVVKKLGLIFSVADEVNSDKPKDVVTTCFPEEGTEVKPNQEVRVYISKGLESFTAPLVKGYDKISAKSLIEGSGLVLGNVTEEFSDTIASGIVMSQNPSEDSPVQKGDKISLVISKGAEVKSTKVPDLNGLSLDEAQRVLQNKKLKLGNKKEIVTNDKSQDGKIFNQDIAAYAEVIEGNSVGVSYYRYEEPKKEEFVVPDFRGKTIAEAKALAESLDISINTVGNDDYIIESQDRKPGDKADVGDVITLTAKEPVPPVTQ